MTMTGKKTILVVDDEPSVLITYRLILEQQGYAVDAALTSQEARQVLSGKRVDLVLCDLSLEQQKSGFEVIDFAREQRPEMAAILLTGYASQDSADRAEQERIPVLYKPIDIQQLLQTISAMLEKPNEFRKANGE